MSVFQTLTPFPCAPVIAFLHSRFNAEALMNVVCEADPDFNTSPSSQYQNYAVISALVEKTNLL